MTGPDDREPRERRDSGDPRAPRRERTPPVQPPPAAQQQTRAQQPRAQQPPPAAPAHQPPRDPRQPPPDPRRRDRVADGPWERRPPPRPQDAWPARRALGEPVEERDSLTGGPRLRPPPPPEPAPSLYPGMEDATQLIQRISDAAGPPEAHIIPAVEQTMRIAERPIAPRREAVRPMPGSADGRRTPPWQPAPPTGGPPRRPPGRGYRSDDPPTELIPKIRLAPETPVSDASASPEATVGTAKSASIARTGALLAVATLVSRLTGFISKVMLTGALGYFVVYSSYNLANTLPNIVFELVIGGVLTSVAIPLLSRARKDPDGGELYTQRLMTVGIAGLLVITVLAVLAAPVFTSIYLGSGNKADPELTNALARMLLPQIFFYGLAALFGAILNTKERFTAPAWAPVVNNLVVICVALVLLRLPGGLFNVDGAMEKPSSTQLWLLGLGTTAGIVIQAAVMLPSLLRSGFRFRWRWGGDPRLKQAGRLMLWSIGYALTSTVAFAVVSRVLTGPGDPGGNLGIFANASLLFQLPYGIVGVSILTAIMPRMSRHAADGDMGAVKNDASLANRLSAIALIPIAAAMVALAVPFAGIMQVARVTADSIESVGVTLGAMAIGLVPLAITLVQMRVFYAMHDARTPTLINLAMVAVRIPLVLLSSLLPADQLVPVIALSTTLSYVVGAVVGELWLRRRFGSMGSRRLAVTGGKTLLAAVVAAGAAWWVADLIAPIERTLPASLLQLLVGALTGLLILVPLLLVLRLPELEPARRRLAAMFGFPVPVAATAAAGDPSVAARPAGLAPSDRRARPSGQAAPPPGHRPGTMDQRRPPDRQPPDRRPPAVRPGPGAGGGAPMPHRPPQPAPPGPSVPRGPAPRPPVRPEQQHRPDQQYDPNSRPPRPPQAPPDRRRQP